MTTTILYRGWITYCGKFGLDEARKRLSDLGVKVGEASGDTFKDCEVTSEVMEKLDPHWGPFIWGLDPVPVPPPPADTFLKFLEDHCPGDDAHDGAGDPRPLLERCGMCWDIYEAHKNAALLQLDAARFHLGLVLPMAKGYAGAHPVGSNAAIVAAADQFYQAGEVIENRKSDLPKSASGEGRGPWSQLDQKNAEG
jgi:hypothetical protein